jgi:hypothetical protein
MADAVYWRTLICDALEYNEIVVDLRFKTSLAQFVDRITHFCGFPHAFLGVIELLHIGIFLMSRKNGDTIIRFGW